MSLRLSAKTEVLRNGYNVAINSDEGQRQREDTMVEIRKNKWEESLIKKRCEGLQPQQFPTSVHASTVEKELESLRSMVAGVSSKDNNLQLEATTQFSKLLSIEQSLPQLQAAWALTNIASGTSENTRVVDHGAVPNFFKILASPSDDVCEQAMWALGNVAGDSPRCRDLVLGHGALSPSLALN